MGYKEYLVKRAIYNFITLFFVLTLNFIIFRIMPADPVSVMVGRLMKPETKQKLYELFGLDKPLHEQYILYIKNMFTLNFGFSFTTFRPVSEEIMARLPNTIALLGTATIVAAILGIVLGLYAALKRGSPVDVVTIGFGLFTYALPVFWLGMVFLLVFGYWFGLFPISGTTSYPPPEDPISYMLDYLWHMFLPLMALVAISFGSWALFTRNIMIDVLTEDYILTARAKGLPERKVLIKHAFRNALLPVITMLGLSLAGVVSGAVLTETVFSWYGIGRFIFQAVTQHDYPSLQATFYIIAVVTILANFIVDILYGILDPRVRITGGRP